MSVKNRGSALGLVFSVMLSSPKGDAGQLPADGVLMNDESPVTTKSIARAKCVFSWRCRLERFGLTHAAKAAKASVSLCAEEGGS